MTPGTRPEAPRRVRVLPSPLERGRSIYPGLSNTVTQMSASEDIEFTCPECGETMVVNPAMRDALRANGCVVCGASVPGDAFEVPDAACE